MQTLILDGSPAPKRAGQEAGELHSWLTDYMEKLRERSIKSDLVQLKDLDIHACTGCWSCWWKTPGLCAFNDGITKLYPSVIKSDLIVWGVPLVLGAQNALIKKTQERLIPLIHPYIDLVGGECHHRKRYEHYPNHVVIVEKTLGDTEEDVELVKILFQRFILNFKSNLLFFGTTDLNPMEAVHETIKH